MRFSPEIYTEKITECVHFYCQYLGFEVKHRIEGFSVLQHAKNPEYEIMFCEPNSSFVNEIFHPPYSGRGLIFQIQVKNVESEYQRLQSESVPIVLRLVEEPVNGKHFTIADPNGILIDIVEFI